MSWQIAIRRCVYSPASIYLMTLPLASSSTPPPLLVSFLSVRAILFHRQAIKTVKFGSVINWRRKFKMAFVTRKLGVVGKSVMSVCLLVQREMGRRKGQRARLVVARANNFFNYILPDRCIERFIPENDSRIIVGLSIPVDPFHTHIHTSLPLVHVIMKCLQSIRLPFRSDSPKRDFRHDSIIELCLQCRYYWRVKLLNGIIYDISSSRETKESIKL